MQVTKETISAYDDAVEHGQNDLAQYLSIKGIIEQAQPANVLVLGAGHDTPLYVQAAKHENGEPGFVHVLEESNEWIEKIWPAIQDSTAVLHKIKYQRQKDPMFPESADLKLIGETCWDVILVDPGQDPLAVRDACWLAKHIKQPENWLFVAGCENSEVAGAVEGILGQTPCVIKGFKLRNTRWRIYKGDHGRKIKKTNAKIKQVTNVRT